MNTETQPQEWTYSTTVATPTGIFTYDGCVGRTQEGAFMVLRALHEGRFKAADAKKAHAALEALYKAQQRLYSIACEAA